MVPFTLTVSLKFGWGFRHRTETEGVKVPFATITTIPNIQTALFIQPTAIGTVYEDLGGNHEYQLRLTQPTQKGGNWLNRTTLSAYTFRQPYESI